MGTAMLAIMFCVCLGMIGMLLFSIGVNERQIRKHAREIQELNLRKLRAEAEEAEQHAEEARQRAINEQLREKR